MRSTAMPLHHIKSQSAPDNIVWLTPDELSERRLANPLPPVQVRELPPLKREVTTSDENAELQNILREAPRIVTQALKRGWIKFVASGPVRWESKYSPAKCTRKTGYSFSPEHRANLSAAHKRRHQGNQPSTL